MPMEEFNFFDTFCDIEEEKQKRDVCCRCGRPSTVCICSFLPEELITLRHTKLHILQHPNEVNRPLHTVAILKAALSADSFVVYKGRRFGPQACPPIHKVVQQEHTFLLYPGHNATKLNDLVKCQGDIVYNAIILDGTWKQAASIYKQNEFLHSLPKVQLAPNNISEYVIRTQPTDNSLSTVECAAAVLELTERRCDIKEILLKPLRGLCQFQLQRGASIHHSKEALLNSTLKS